LFPTPLLSFRRSSIFVRHIWGYHCTYCCGGIFSALRVLARGRGRWGL
jgi:hypothetical protein